MEDALYFHAAPCVEITQALLCGPTANQIAPD